MKTRVINWERGGGVFQNLSLFFGLVYIQDTGYTKIFNKDKYWIYILLYINFPYFVNALTQSTTWDALDEISNVFCNIDYFAKFYTICRIISDAEGKRWENVECYMDECVQCIPSCINKSVIF